MTILESCFWFDIENFIWPSAPNRLVVIIPGHHREQAKKKKRKSNHHPAFEHGAGKVLCQSVENPHTSIIQLFRVYHQDVKPHWEGWGAR